VRRQYLAGNRLDLEHPQPLILYYESFAAAREKPTKSAEDGLLYAFALAPFDSDLRLPVGKIYLARGKAAEARAALLPVIYSIEAGDLSQRFRGVLTKLDTEGPAAALAEIERLEAEATAKAKTGGGKS
jgi:hypothetical protein